MSSRTAPRSGQPPLPATDLDALLERAELERDRRARLKAGMASRHTETMRAFSRRDQILEVATELFATRGYHGTSIRDIAEATGVHPSSLYAHIRGKEDLLYEIVTGAAAVFLASLEMVAKGRGTPAEKLRSAMRSHVSVIADARERARVFLEEWTALSEARGGEIRALRDRYEELWDGILREGVRTGAFRRVDRRFARLLVLSAANWMYTWYRPEGPLSPEQIADRFTGLLLRGLAAERRTNGGARR